MIAWQPGLQARLRFLSMQKKVDKWGKYLYNSKAVH